MADLAVLGFEIFARSRQNLLPNPDSDSISALLFHLTNERVKFSDVYNTKKGKLVLSLNKLLVTGVILVDEIEYQNLKDIKDKIKVFYSKSYYLNRFSFFICFEFYQKLSRT